jgi:IS30 family transposase
MPRSYEQLNKLEREYIAIRRKQAATQAQIARELGRHRSTVGREVRRNRNARGYYYSVHAHYLALERRRKVRKPKKLACGPLRRSVERAIRMYWSPEQIEGRRKRKAMEPISRMTIYRHIQEHSEELSDYLRGPEKHRPKRERIHGRIMIKDRPQIVENRLRVGDWEGDTIRGPIRSKACIATHVERKSYYLVARKLQQCSGNQMNQETITGMEGLPIHTLTVDNGMEFGSFKKLEQALGIQVYFAEEKKPWQRGRNENTNRLLRQFFPKGTDFSGVNPREVEQAAGLLNNRPRKALNYETPEATMKKAVVALEI